MSAESAARWRQGTDARFARDAFAILLTSAVARGIGLLSQAWAARCLGPTNLGISGVVQSFAQQTALFCGVGLDNVAAREISRRPGAERSLVGSVVRLRLKVAAAVAALWVAAALLFAPADVRLPWLLGAAVVFAGAFSLQFVFQGLERLPLFNLATMSGALVTSAIIFAFFRPGTSVGMDLAAYVAGAVITIAIAWWLYRRHVGASPLAARDATPMRPLLRQSSRYLAQVVLVFFYSQYQVPLIAWRLGAHDAGIFRSAFMMAAGLELAFNSATSLVLPRLVRWHAEGVDVFRRRQRALAQRFALIGLAAWIAASLVAPLLFERVLGGDFATATPVFRILVLGRAIVFVSQVFMFGLTALHRDNAFLGVTVVGCAVSLATNALVIDSIGLVGVAWASVLAEIVILMVGWRLCERALDQSRATAATEGPGAGPWT